MIYVDLIINLSLLVSLTIISGFVNKCCIITKKNRNLSLILQGIIFGGAAILGMMRPLNLGDGLIFDGRSVMVSLCTLFFGPLSGIIASIIPAVYRILVGGVGAMTGVFVILSSFTAGMVARLYLQPQSKIPSATYLYIFGVVVHILMLVMIFTLPEGAGMEVVMKIGLPVMILYPLATILAGKILSDLIEYERYKSLSEIQEFLAQTTTTCSDNGVTANSFFHALAKYISKTLDMDFVCIDRLEGDGLNATTLAVWCDGVFQDNVTYALKDTPCGDVVGKNVCCFPANVCKFFPKDQVLQELKAESYVGVTLFNHKGKPIGLIAVISKKPLIDRYIAELTLKMIAVRASGELERLNAELELIESERNYRQVINTMHESLAVIDIDGNFLLASEKAAKKIANIQPNDMVGKNIREFVTPEQAELLIEKYKDVILNKKTLNQEIMLSLSEGDKWFINTLQPIEFGYDKTDAVLSMSLEITKHKRTEAEKAKLQQELLQAQKMESIGRLAGGVAHDFNNMLGVILGNTELALDQVESPSSVYDNLQDIRKAAERSAALTRQLLAFARKQTIAPKEIDLNQTIESMLNMLKRIIGEDIELAWIPCKEIWTVNMDTSQIDQILVNLCVNSRDAIFDVGKITIETNMTVFDKNYCDNHYGFIQGEFVMLAVSDNGCGMDKETLNKIFEPFFTTKETGKGTGLGLSTVYGIVKQNRGFINVYSEPNQGTTFKIYFPRHKVEVQPVVTQNAIQTVEQGNETILLVEDEPSILKLTQKLLEKFGYNVITASTPGEAIRLAKTHYSTIDLLMTDVVMPEMNGRDLAKNIMAIFPDIKRLFMSGYTANVIAHHGVLDEGVNFIQKPFSKQELATKLREVLSRV